jgi:large subunit ribosomal protein L2
MPVKNYKPVTPTLRYKTSSSFDQLTGDAPYKPLLKPKRRKGGRNNTGRLTVRHHGGGHKQYYRVIDFRRTKRDVPGVIETIEYDPNRTCYIALVKYIDGERRYILATTKMKKGMQVVASDTCEVEEGNCTTLGRIPQGTLIHNIELQPLKGGQIARSAGAYAEIVAKEGNLVQIKLPSTEVRNISANCYATVGQVSNPEHMNIVVGSAGRKRWMGVRPTVRGVAMNPVDHPMGGGEGKTSGGGHPVSPWGQKAKGLKTRRAKKLSDKYIVRRRRK